MYKIAVVGAGNVAWHLAPALETAGHRITEVYSRHLVNAAALGNHLYDARETDSLDLRSSRADLVLLCVPDRVIREVVEKIQLPAHAVLAHTSGTQPMNLLQKATPDTGVFYPLQTFSKAKTVDFRQVPICLEASDDDIRAMLEEIAKGLTRKIHHLDSRQRQVLHISAVFACNFTNHLLSISKDILAGEEMNFEMLHPLIEETMRKALTLQPERAQTGPAVRNDDATIQQHLKYLSPQTEYAKIYKILTASIQHFYHVGKDK